MYGYPTSAVATATAATEQQQQQQQLLGLMGAATAWDLYTAAAVDQVCVLYMGNIPYSHLLSIKPPSSIIFNIK